MSCLLENNEEPIQPVLQVSNQSHILAQLPSSPVPLSSSNPCQTAFLVTLFLSLSQSSYMKLYPFISLYLSLSLSLCLEKEKG